MCIFGRGRLDLLRYCCKTSRLASAKCSYRTIKRKHAAAAIEWKTGGAGEAEGYDKEDTVLRAL